MANQGASASIQYTAAGKCPTDEASGWVPGLSPRRESDNASTKGLNEVLNFCSAVSFSDLALHRADVCHFYRTKVFPSRLHLSQSM